MTINVAQHIWANKYNTLYANRVLAQDISKILAGKQFDPITNYLPPKPVEEARSVEAIEMTLMQWALEE